MINISPKLDLRDNRIEGNGIKDSDFQLYYSNSNKMMTLQRTGKAPVSLSTRMETQRLNAQIIRLEQRIEDLEGLLVSILSKIG